MVTRKLYLLPVYMMIALLIGARPAVSETNMIDVDSKFGFEETVERLKATIEAKGLKVIAQVDHAKGAAGADLELRPTLLVLFGNPKAGTPVMQQDQRAGLDLPLRVVVWQGADGGTVLTYRDPEVTAQAWPIEPIPPQASMMSKAIKAITEEAAGR